MTRLALAVLLLARCGNSPLGGGPPLEDLFAAVLARMETSPVADQDHLVAPNPVLAEVGRSDRRLTAALLPSPDRWRLATQDALQGEADSSGQAVWYVRLTLPSAGTKATVQIIVFGLPPRNELGVGCATEEIWDGSSGTWTFVSRRLAWCA